MRFLYKHGLLALAGLWGWILPAWGATPEPPARPPAHVVDLAGILPPSAEARLNAYLRELEQKTTVQMVVLTVQSLDGEAIEAFSLRIAERWKLGQKGKDNGVLLTVSLGERRYRFEVGYGLEAILPDSLVGSIGRRYLVPHFRKGEYARGLLGATVAVIQEIAKHEGVEITGMVRVPPPRHAPRKVGALESLLGLVLLLLAFLFFARRPGLLFLFLLSSGGMRGWSSGGGFGGGFGGFGGGGGAFGGGGASGGW